MKNIDVARLWLHDEVRSNRLKVRWAKSEHNVSEWGTKALSRGVIARQKPSDKSTCRATNSAGEEAVSQSVNLWTRKQGSDHVKTRCAESFGLAGQESVERIGEARLRSGG